MQVKECEKRKNKVQSACSTTHLVGDKDELVSKATLQNGSRLVTDADDLRVVGVLACVQLVTDLAGDSGVDGAAET